MAITAQTKVLTLDYWKSASKLSVGDYVFDQQGKLVQIKLIQEYRADDCFEVKFNDYLRVAGDQHLAFMCETPKYRNRLVDYKGKFQFRRPLKEFSVSELLELPLKNHRNRLKYSIPTAKPLQLPHMDLPVPPFVFGFWFFARRANKKLVAAPGTFDLVQEKLKDYGYQLKIGRMRSSGEHEFSLTPTVESQLVPNIPKKIPNNYLLASAEQRSELLSGILCSKPRQYSPKTDIFRITSAHLGTIKQIQGLVESLASKTQIKEDETKKYFTLFFKSRIRLVPNQISPPVKVHHARRFITSITPLPPQSCLYVETDGEDNTILVEEGFIPIC